MTMRLAILAVAATLAAPSAAQAQGETPATPPTPPTVVVGGLPAPEERVTMDVRAGDIDAEALRAALERDLGVHVELVRGDGARVIVDMRDGVVRLRVRSDNAHLERETVPSGDASRDATSLSLLIGNLVRDESTEVLSLLQLEVGPRPALEAEPPEDEVEPLEPDGSEVPEVEVPEVEVPEVETPEVAASAPLETIPFGIDFLPGVGVSSAFGVGARRAFSLGVVGALHGGIDGFGASSVLDIGGGPVDGVQVSGVLAVAAGDVRGVQGSGVIGIGGAVDGAQVSSVLAVAGGDVDGLQASTVAVAAGQVRGAQLGVIGVNGGLDGFQASVVGVAGGPVRGAQAGVVNVAGEVDGAQLGVVNVSGGRVRGLQLGIVNISEEADAAIGLINVHTRGRTQVRAGLDTSGLIEADLVHGGVFTHTVVRLGVMPFLDDPAFVAGLGLGLRAPLDDDGLHLDFELISSVMLDATIANGSPDTTHELRILAGIPVADVLAISIGASYRLHMTVDTGSSETLAPLVQHTIANSGSVLLRGWPALFAGVELF